MALRTLSRRVWIVVAGIGALVSVALWPSAVPVDTATVTRGPLVVTIDGEGKTRVRERYIVSTPVYGRVLRIDLEPGDQVTAGQVVARMRAEPPALLDARSRAEALAAIASARASLGRAQAEEQRARAQLAQLTRDLARARDLAQHQLISSQEFDTRDAAVRVAEESASAAAFAVRTATSELQRAQARLNPPATEAGRIVTVTSPVGGVVLRQVRESESLLPAGEPLLEIGDPHDLEVVADLLSADVVQIAPGARAMIEEWGGTPSLPARVRRIEPAGFTKVSALGVDEQRVNVLFEFTDHRATRSLGDAYRVEVRVVTWESASVLKVPTGALFRDGARWAVYSVNGNRARLTPVSIGHQSPQEAEVLSGISEGTRVVLHPGDVMSDGVRVRPRTSP
jgi:HlyD family secretion protein